MGAGLLPRAQAGPPARRAASPPREVTNRPGRVLVPTSRHQPHGPPERRSPFTSFTHKPTPSFLAKMKGVASSAATALPSGGRAVGRDGGARRPQGRRDAVHRSVVPSDPLPSGRQSRSPRVRPRFSGPLRPLPCPGACREREPAWPRGAPLPGTRTSPRKHSGRRERRAPGTLQPWQMPAPHPNLLCQHL